MFPTKVSESRWTTNSNYDFAQLKIGVMQPDVAPAMNEGRPSVGLQPTFPSRLQSDVNKNHARSTAKVNLHKQNAMRMANQAHTHVVMNEQEYQPTHAKMSKKLSQKWARNEQDTFLESPCICWMTNCVCSSAQRTTQRGNRWEGNKSATLVEACWYYVYQLTRIHISMCGKRLIDTCRIRCWRQQLIVLVVYSLVTQFQSILQNNIGSLFSLANTACAWLRTDPVYGMCQIHTLLLLITSTEDLFAQLAIDISSFYTHKWRMIAQHCRCGSEKEV